MSASLRQRVRADVDTSILDATERVVGRDGIAGLKMQSVAEEAGVAVGTLYNHFGDKERLIGHLVVRHRRELSAALREAQTTTKRENLEQQLHAFVVATIELFDRRRAFVKAALDSELWRGHADAVDPEQRELRVRAQLENRALSLVRAGLRQKRLAAQPAERLAAYLSGMLRGILMTRARATELSPVDDEASALVSLFLFGAGRAATSGDGRGHRRSKK